MDIYRQMYRESVPVGDFDEMMNIGVTAKPDWFLNYFLSEDRQLGIIDFHCRKHKLSRRECHNVSVAVLLGSAPSAVKKK